MLKESRFEYKSGTQISELDHSTAVEQAMFLQIQMTKII